jgi:hypothetical protein
MILIWLNFSSSNWLPKPAFVAMQNDDGLGELIWRRERRAKAMRGLRASQSCAGHPALLGCD